MSHRTVLAAVAGLSVGLPAGFVLSPDPTGVVPLAVGLVVATAVAAGVYVASGTRDTVR